MAERVGFIGAAGLMGHGMAKNILAAGHPLSIMIHRNAERVADLLAGGATASPSIAELTRSVDIVVLCVPSSVEVEACMLGTDGILAAARSGQIVIDTTTAQPSSTLRIYEVASAKSVALADAPLMRSPKDAEAGKLNSTVGADPALFERIRPLLATYCENIWHVGPVGAGHTLKLVNNFIAQGTAAIIAEACVTARKSGVDLEKLFEVISNGGANSSVFQRMMPWILEQSEGGMIFKLALARKDVRYYTRLAEEVNVASIVGAAVHQAFTLALNQGEGEDYVPSLARGLGKANGVSIGPRRRD